MKPELSPAGLVRFACGAFSFPAILHRPGRGSRLGFGRAELGLPHLPNRANAKGRLSLQAEPRIVQRQVRPSERSEQHRSERSELPHIAPHRRNGEGANQQMARNAQLAKASCRIPAIAGLGICASTANATRFDLASAHRLSDRLATTGLRARRPVSVWLDICGPSVRSRPAQPSRVVCRPSHIKFLVRTASVIDRAPPKLTPCSATPLPLLPCLSAPRDICSRTPNFGEAGLRHWVAPKLDHEPTVAPY